jgi:hypothetical protein
MAYASLRVLNGSTNSWSVTRPPSTYSRVNSARLRGGPDDLVAALVQPVQVVEEIKGSQEHLPADLQLARRGLKLAADLLAVLTDAVDLFPELVLGPAFFGREVEKVALLRFQFSSCRVNWPRSSSLSSNCSATAAWTASRTVSRMPAGRMTLWA